MKLLVRAGAHRRRHCPILVVCPDRPLPEGLASGSSVMPVQADGEKFAAIVPDIEAGGEAAFVASATTSTGAGGVTVSDDGARIEVALDGEPFTTYHYAGVPARPYFWPLLAPGGVPVTRAWPMRADVPGETHDHKHHRSMYFAFGEVNGADNWSEEPGHAYTIHRSVDEIVSGPVFGRFTTTSDWTDASRARLLSQMVTVTFWASPPDGPRLVDVDLRLTAMDADVEFGDTKEGGLLTVRVATPMDVPNGGRIENSYGGVDEAETWGFAAHWCDYSGTVDGAHVGVAVMDHPLSFRYPTYWHVRDYGLMGANPFALNAYTHGAKDGSYLLKRGDTMRFLYRVAVHRGNATDADIRERYMDFVSPPAARVAD